MTKTIATVTAYGNTTMEFDFSDIKNVEEFDNCVKGLVLSHEPFSVSFDDVDEDAPLPEVAEAQKMMEDFRKAEAFMR